MFAIISVLTIYMLYWILTYIDHMFNLFKLHVNQNIYKLNHQPVSLISLSTQYGYKKTQENLAVATSFRTQNPTFQNTHLLFLNIMILMLDQFK